MTSRLDEYQARSLISLTQAKAGRAFAHDASQVGRGTSHADMSRLPRGLIMAGGYAMTAGDAARRYHEACRYLGGLKDIAVLVCVDDKPARGWTDARGENAHAAMPMLKLALDQLVGFYQLSEAA